MKATAYLAGLALAALGASALCSTASAGMVLKFGHVGEPGSLFETSAKEFARCANEKLGDKGEVQVFGSSQLGKDQELLQKLKLGQVQFALPSSVMSSVSDTFGVFEMPYLIQNRDHMKRVTQKMGDVFQKAAEGKGYHILAFWENGFRNITNNVRPIVEPADLQGIKLRTPKGAWRVKMFESYGASPTPMAFSEVFTALKTGVIDGQENPLAQIWSAKFPEVQKYLSMTGHVYTPAYILTSQKQYESWPDDIRKTLDGCAVSTQDFVYKTAAQLDKDLVGKIEAMGTKVNEADKPAFIAASKPIYEEFAKSVDGGQKLIDEIQVLAKGS
ncbi:tripartite ATP-independent transporter solute receptor, DctP family [Tistlia consotensis]|uniref:Tripartite ATP-independent transporter solute receptor, DctP family n=1 Tax=Tistlia consotensis USBA 355 TaxID=560819 RepID=A0A1Y6B4W0_9PROT|nr:TRAP transporter substrate-binding protein [Tistlia consotensis]SME92262.1 tripartite ATP-independent transporter solute receptor, DctP family [Tistlia consotensis USBA 355]SNR27925.1 tripartite ATP-independent transporter solute receptor, DctP family [Tistlia consotensis]